MFCIDKSLFTFPLLPGQNYCAVNNGGCTHLCLATPTGRSCKCPNAVSVDCVETDSGYWNNNVVWMFDRKLGATQHY